MKKLKFLKIKKLFSSHWTGITNLSVDTVKFRYFIGNYLQSDATKDPVLVISKWEAHFTPVSFLKKIKKIANLIKIKFQT